VASRCQAFDGVRLDLGRYATFGQGFGKSAALARGEVALADYSGLQP
jgi:hypothetical protein